MDAKEAIACLSDPEGKTPSELGKAVDVLYQKHRTYQKIARQLPLSSGFLSSRHRIFQLPKGIQWKVDQEQIGISQANQITRLKDEDDQWLLAVTVAEKELTSNECEKVVNLVLKENWSIRDALSTVTGVRFAEISPPMLLLPVGVDFWFALIRASWGQSKDWQDLCYQLIREGVDVDTKEVATQIEYLAKDFSIRLEEIATSLRESGERYREDTPQ